MEFWNFENFDPPSVLDAHKQWINVTLKVNYQEMTSVTEARKRYNVEFQEILLENRIVTVMYPHGFSFLLI